MTRRLRRAAVCASCGREKALQQVLAILEQVHKAGIVHRDVRLSNFFEHPDTGKVRASTHAAAGRARSRYRRSLRTEHVQVFLSDFGCAVPVGEVGFEGAALYVPEDTEPDVPAQPAHDLLIVARAAYRALVPAHRFILPVTPQAAMNFWLACADSDRRYMELLSPARSVDYSGLSNAVERLLPAAVKNFDCP